MTAHPPLWVVDASVAIKLFITEDYSAETGNFFEKLNLNSPDHIYVPDLFYAECANILWKYVRRAGYSAGEAKKDIGALKSLRLRPVSGAELMEKAFELALRWDITAYDATYLALAERLKAPLVTADEKLVKRVKSPNLRIEWIGEIS